LNCEDPEVLAKLQSQFPECFTQQPPVPITWEQLLDKQINILINHHIRSISLEAARIRAPWSLLGALEYFNIPTMASWWYFKGNPPPKEVTQQLLGKEIVQPMYVEYQGKQCLVVHLPFPCGVDTHTRYHQPNVMDTTDIEVAALVLVRADMVIFGSLPPDKLPNDERTSKKTKT
jgi:hypothetical protein